MSRIESTVRSERSHVRVGLSPRDLIGKWPASVRRRLIAYKCPVLKVLPTFAFGKEKISCSQFSQKGIANAAADKSDIAHSKDAKLCSVALMGVAEMWRRSIGPRSNTAPHVPSLS